jgi:hypothetical protein
MKHQYLLAPPEPILCLPEPQFTLPQWMIDLLDKAHDRAHEIMVEQMKINPDAIEALYG